MFAFPYGVEGRDDLEEKIDEQHNWIEQETTVSFGSLELDGEDDGWDIDVNYEDALYAYQAPGAYLGRRRSVTENLESSSPVPGEVKGSLDLGDIVAPYPISYLPTFEEEFAFERHTCEEENCPKCALEGAFKDTLPPLSAVRPEPLGSPSRGEKSKATKDKEPAANVQNLTLSVNARKIPTIDMSSQPIHAPLSEAALLLQKTLREAIVSPASSPRNAQSPRNTQSPRSPTSLSFFPKSTETPPTPQLSLQMLSNNIRYSIPITLPLPSLCKPAVQTRIAKALAAAMREEVTGKHSGNTHGKPKRTRPVVNEASAAAAGGGASPLFGGASPLFGGSRRAAGPQCDCTDLCFCHSTPYKERLGSPIVPSPIATAGPHSIPETKSARTTPFVGAINSKVGGVPPDGRLSDTRFSFTHVPATSAKLEDGSQTAPTVFRLASMRSSPRNSLDRSRESGISGNFLGSYSSQPRAVTPLPFPGANAAQPQAPMPVQPAAQPVPTKNRFLYSKHWKQTPVGASARMLSQEMKVESGWRNWLDAETQHAAATVRLLQEHVHESESLENQGSMAENTSAGAKIEEQESQLCLDFGYIPQKNSKLRNSRDSRGRTLSRQRSRSARTATSASSRDPAEDSIEAPPELPAVPHAQTHTATSARKNSLGDEDNIYNAVRGKTHIPVRILRLRFEQQLLRAERRAKDKADAERLLGDKDHLSVETAVRRAVRRALLRKKRQSQKATVEKETSDDDRGDVDINSLHELLKRL